MSAMGEPTIDALTSEAFAALVAAPEPFVILLPVGSVEPHGPHLGLVTDTVISYGAARRAVAELGSRGVTARIAPAVPYGVTECAAQFAGAVSVSASALGAYLRAVVDGFLAGGVAHVCLINNHLEPAHDAVVRQSLDGVDPGRASVACPLTRRWARTLTDEFKSGACHAGQYETSIVMAERPELVDEVQRGALDEVPISLATKLREGVTDFMDMGLTRAYAGSPAAASAEEGERTLALLATMVVTEVTEALATLSD